MYYQNKRTEINNNKIKQQLTVEQYILWTDNRKLFERSLKRRQNRDSYTNLSCKGFHTLSIVTKFPIKIHHVYIFIRVCCDLLQFIAFLC